MDEHLLRIYQLELRTQCRFIVIGIHQVNTALAAEAGPLAWFAVQGVLISASNASKLLWGSRAKHEVRKPLRESVGVTDSSALNSRELRNDFEHFDERLERWFGKETGQVYIERAIGPPGEIIVRGQAPTDQFGHFDPSTGTVSFWENSADLNAIVAEAQRILGELNAIQDRRARPMAPPP